MRIAQVAPLYESVPPLMYGGTERVVSYLTESLVEMGHDVTLFASGDSVTSARLIPVVPESLRLNPKCIDQLVHHVLLLERVFAHKDYFDLIHFHIDYLHFPLSRRERKANLTTLHGRLDLPDLKPLYEEFPDMPVISISNSQRQHLPNANWRGTVYHGLPGKNYQFNSQPRDYLAFLGRVAPEKGLDEAIRIAQKVGMPLKIAAKVDKADKEYYKTTINPLLTNDLVEFMGEIGYERKCDLLGQARALLFPVNWPEPFGLVMIESMACGTPVIAYPRGSVPEIIEHGVNGFLVADVESAARAVQELEHFDRRACRDSFEQRFTATRMARNYLSHYHQLLGDETPSATVDRGVPVG